MSAVPDQPSDPGNVTPLRPVIPKEQGTPEAPLPATFRQCTARSTTSGRRCRKSAIKGGTVCPSHGGRAPQVKERARIRLASLIEPAITTLGREMVNAQHSADRQRAANSILDRAGLARGANEDMELARSLLIDRLLTLRESGE